MATIDANAQTLKETAPPAAGALAPAAEKPGWTPHELRANAGWAIVISLFLLAVFVGLRFLPAVCWPLVIAAIGAYLLDPPVRLLVARGMSRTVATAALMGAGLVAGTGVVLALLPVVVTQAQSLPGYLRRTADAVLPQLEAAIGERLPGDWGELTLLAREHLHEVLGNLLPKASSTLSILLGKSLSLLSFALGALVIPVVGFYLLRGWPQVLAGVQALVPERHRGQVRERMGEVDRMLGGFIRGQLTMAAVLAVLYSAALTAAGLKFSLLIGLVTGFGNLVPYVGTATGLALATAITMAEFGADHHLALVLATFGVLVTVDSLFITPRIVGNRVGLSPAAVIVAVLACGSLFGFAGVLLAVPSAAILKNVVRVSMRVWKQSRTFREE